MEEDGDGGGGDDDDDDEYHTTSAPHSIIYLSSLLSVLTNYRVFE